jgi:hypothetical protein
LLSGDQLVRPTEEDLAGQVPAQLSTQGALNGHRLEGKLIPARGYIAAAPLAGDNKQSPLDCWEPESHSMSIGEVIAKIFHRPGSSIVFEIYPMIYQKLIGLAREYRCLGGTICAVK